MDETNEPSRATDCCGDWRKSVEDFNDCSQKFIRDEPAKAVGIALLAGVLLTIFPVGRVLGAVVRLVFALARPFLLVLGALKVYEEFQKKQQP